MILIEPAAWRKAQGLSEAVCIGVPPAFGGGAGWGAVWGSLSVDNFSDPPTPVRVMIKDVTSDPTKWYSPVAPDKDTVNLASGRSFGWQFKKGDQCVSLINKGNKTVSLLIETAPR